MLTCINASDILSSGLAIMRERGTVMKSQCVKERMDDMKITPAFMAGELHMDVSTYYRKMQKNGEDFSAADLLVFKRVLRMDDKTALDFLLS